MGERTIGSSFSTSPRFSVFGNKNGHPFRDRCPLSVPTLVQYFYGKGTKSFQSRNTNLNFLIWKVHHLTTSSSFFFVQVEALLESPARISLNEAIIFGMLVLRGFLYCLTFASTLARSRPHAAKTAYFSKVFQFVMAFTAGSSTSTSPKKSRMGFLSALRTSSSVLPVRHSASRICFFEVRFNSNLQTPLYFPSRPLYQS